MSKHKKSSFLKNKWVKRSTRYLIVLSLLVIILLASFFLSVYKGVFGKVPSVSDIKKVEQAWSSEVLTHDGQLIGKYFIRDRVSIKRKDISDFAIQALVATEDARFFNHEGIDFRGLARVFFKTLLMGDKSSGGGSTISQQLVKNLFPREHHGFLSMPISKIKEAIVATRIENNYSKDEVLEFYLNTVPFGENVYGIGAAAQRYFNTSASQLKVEQAAVLIGILKANTYYNPRINPDNALKRRNTVLAQMLKYGYLKAPQKDSLSDLPLTLDYQAYSHHDGLATHFRDEVKKKVLTWCQSNTKPDGSNYDLYQDGLRIITTIDEGLQRHAEKAVNDHMSQLQAQFDDHWSNGKPWRDIKNFEKNLIKNSEPYKKLEAQEIAHEKIIEHLSKKKNTTVFTWQGKKDTLMSSIDSIFHHECFLQTGFMVSNPKNGHVLAWVGSTNHEFYQYDYVKARRQVGSTFKPILYAAALQDGLSPCSYVSNRAIRFRDNEDWSPENSDGGSGGKYSLLGALTQSVNVVSARIIKKIGVPKVIELARSFGINSKLPEVPSLALGVADISLYEMVNTYNAINNTGRYNEPQYILRIEDREGNMLEDFSQKESKEVLDADLATQLRMMMQSVIDHGTGKRLRNKYNIETDIAGKTGTTQRNSDGWFIGFTPTFTAGAWVGGNYRTVRFRSTKLGQGANTALPIWALFYKNLESDDKYASMCNQIFDEPSSEIQAALDCEMYKENFWDLFVKGDKKKSNKKKRKKFLKSIFK